MSVMNVLGNIVLNFFLQAMNQAQALLSVDYRILRTISLNEYFFIIDIAYTDEGTICLSVIKQAHVTRVGIGRNDVKMVLPTGSYINYRNMQLHYIEDNIVNTHSFPETTCLYLESPKLFQNNVSENPFQTHGIAVCKSGLILICQWNRKSRDQSAGKIVKLWHVGKKKIL